MNGLWSHSWVSEIVGLEPGQSSPCLHCRAMAVRARPMERGKGKKKHKEKKRNLTDGWLRKRGSLQDLNADDQTQCDVDYTCKMTVKPGFLVLR